MLTVWLGGCALTKLVAIGRSYPELDGELELAVDGPAAEVELIRDLHGVPHVQAESESDAWWALGFAHGQDRLFAADLQRRVAWGELAAWFGPDAVESDVFARALDLRGRASRTLEALAPETRATLEAYARGVNAGAESLGALPIEYRLVQAEFTPWTPEDSLGVVYLLAWTLQENLAGEVAAIELRELPAAKLDALLRAEPNTPPIDAGWDALRGLAIGDWSAELGGLHSHGEASNAWVVGGARTASGLPIVANDPHLTQRLPSLWYAADLHGGTLHAAGLTLPGLPAVVIGHSEQVAWGLTSSMADAVDLAVVQRVGPGTVRIEGEEETLRSLRLEVEVAGADPVGRVVALTSIGPVISDLGADALVVLRWSALEVDDHTLDALGAAAHATSVDELFAAVRNTPSIVLTNVVAGDTAGDFGWITGGPTPMRQAHSGRVPYDGSGAGQGWGGFAMRTLEERAPGRGYLASANHRPAATEADAISTAYVPNHRALRVEELVVGVQHHTPEDEQRIQLDRRDMLAAWNLPALLFEVEPSTLPAQQCLRDLRAWDLESRADSAGAAIWATFLDAYLRAALADDLDPAGVETALAAMTVGRTPLNNGLFEAAFVADRRTAVSAALEVTCNQLTAALGPDRATWRWGALHPLQLRHPFTSGAPALFGAWSAPDTPWYGSGATLAAGDYALGGELVKPVGGMVSARIVMPLADLGASTFVQPGGQSGQPRSPLYLSHLAHFAAGQVLPLWFDREDVQANAAWRLTIR
jgi:penicillin G amidase